MPAIELTAYTFIIANNDGSRIEISSGGDALSIRLADSVTRTASGSRLVPYEELWDALLAIVGPPPPAVDWEGPRPQRKGRILKRG